MKEQPKPLAENLTKKGTPRKRAIGGGRKPAGRSADLPRVTPAAAAQADAIAAALDCTKAEAIEHALRVAVAKLTPSAAKSPHR